MTIKSKKWLLCCTYNPNKLLKEKHLQQLQKQLEASSERYENLKDLTLRLLNFALFLS